jgi:hypothetical protein
MVAVDAQFAWDGGYPALIGDMDQSLKVQGWTYSGAVPMFGFAAQRGWTKKLSDGDLATLEISPAVRSEHWNLLAVAPPVKGFTGAC